MRLDKYLKVSRLIKRRTVANEACDKFDTRFRKVEQMADKPLSAYSEPELVALWKAAKEQDPS